LWHDKTPLALCMEVLVLMMGLGFLSPILPKFVQALGIAPTQIGTMVGLVITVFGIAQATMDLPAGRLAHLWGRRPLLILGPGLVTISAIGCGLAMEYWQLVVFRLLQGLGSALFSVAAIIGFVGEYLGYRAPFFCFAGLALLAALWCYFRIPETKGRRPTGVFAPSNLAVKNSSIEKPAPLHKNLNFILISMVSIFTLITLSGNQITLIPLLGYERLNLREGQVVGLTLTLVAAMHFAFVFLAGRLSDKVGRKTIIVPGGIITALGLILLIHSPSYQFFLLSAVVLGVGRGFGGAVPTAYVADIAQSQNYEHTMALYHTVSDIGFVVDPILLGWLKDTRGLDFPFFLGAGLLFVTVILFAAFAKETVDRSTSQ